MEKAGEKGVQAEETASEYPESSDGLGHVRKESRGTRLERGRGGPGTGLQAYSLCSSP